METLSPRCAKPPMPAIRASRLIQYADMNLAAVMDSQTYPTTEWVKQQLQRKATRKGDPSGRRKMPTVAISDG